MKATITKTDLKKALAHVEAHGWGQNHCLIAQTAKRLKERGWFSLASSSADAENLMGIFDRANRSPVYPRTREGQREIDLALLNLVLPMKIDY